MKTRRVVIRLSDDEMECLSEYGQLLVSYGYFPVGSGLRSTSSPPAMAILGDSFKSSIGTTPEFQLRD